MNKNKNIDDLFKENFKNFEATPSPQVWNKIQAKLEEKEDRKVIPLWFKLGGIAALLALLFTIGNSVFNQPFNNNTTPTITEENSNINTENSENNRVQNTNEVTNTVEVASEDTNDLVKNTSEDTTVKKSSNTSETKIAFKNDTEPVSEKKNSSENIIRDPSNTNVTDAIAQNDVNKNISELTKDKNGVSNKTVINKEKNISTNKKYVASEEIKNNNVLDSQIINTKTEVAALKEENKRSIFDAINEKNEEEIVAIVDNNPNYRWEVSPNVGPVYYNTLSEGSSIDPSFSDNPKSGDLNIAYGVQVSYNLNNRLSVRSGLSNVNLSYSTTGIELGNGPVAVALKSIDYDKNHNVLITVDQGSLVNQNSDGEFGAITPKSTSGDPSLNQKLSYYEVPLELKYAVLNKKFGVNLIGGFSTLFLGENEISVDAGDFNETLGEANNLSTISFTTNIGLGLNYSFSKKLMFNIEPMFKYQLNPYTDSSVDFKPYYIGVYTGLSFKF